MSRNVAVITILILILFTFGFWWWSQSQKEKSPFLKPQPVVSTAPVAIPSSSPLEQSTPSASKEAMVEITSAGFNPKSITIKAGETVTWANGDSKPHQVNSAPHPTHTAYPPLNQVGVLKPEESGSLTFPDPGTYRYHDHLNPTLTGTVIVQ